MKTIFAFKTGADWGYVERQQDVPANATASFEQTFTDLSAEELEWFSGDCLIYNEEAQSVAFDHAKFDAEVRNVLFSDDQTTEGRQQIWLEQRTAAYPSITDQLDMLYHDQVNGTTVWKDTIAAAKLSTPKP
jgi:hypothetical protein